MEDIFGIVIVVWLVGAWLTHIIFCLSTASWGFLVAGALMFPIWIIHWIGLWFGAF